MYAIIQITNVFIMWHYFVLFVFFYVSYERKFHFKRKKNKVFEVTIFVITENIRVKYVSKVEVILLQWTVRSLELQYFKCCNSNILTYT